MTTRPTAHAVVWLISLLLAVATVAEPETVFLNATVYTSDDRRPMADAFRVVDGVFADVGAADRVLKDAGHGARVVDLSGATVLPGLIDAHGHLAGLGQLEVGVIDLAGTTSYERVIELVVERADEMPEGGWIIGRGWDHESWPGRELPTHGLLSEAVPGHPVWLSRVDGHAALGNARAMELAGVSESSVSPDGGEILRDESGAPTGVFVDAAEGLVTRVVPADAQGDARAVLLAGQALCVSAGLTGVHDAGVDPSMVEVYRGLESSGELKLRVHAMMPSPLAPRWFENNEPDRPTGSDRFAMRAAKAYADGAMGSRGAWLLEPYEDRPVGPAGEPYVGLAVTEPAEIESLARHGLARGYQVCTHAIGDRANREVLDAYERAFRDAGLDGASARFRIEHAQLLHPDDVGRFAELGVIASMQPTHCTSDMRWIEDRVGSDRIAGAYAWQTLLDSGALIAGGSDFPVESQNPFLGFYAAVTRQNIDREPRGGWRPGERMTREQALRSMTIDAAYASFDEDRLGSIEIGKRADFVVIDRDVMTCPAWDIPGTVVLGTWIDGERVYSAPGRR
ncbi:MAG: amidohydrolase family protein [Planctomycetota bacterium]